MPRQVYLIAVGACAIDTILTVPHFPAQDSKLRATDLTKRRGGNCPNTLEVLKQLIQYESARLDAEAVSNSLQPHTKITPVPKLSLIATFPSKTCPGLDFMKSSFQLKSICTSIKTINGDEKTIITADPELDFSPCVYREEHSEPISSYIISDASTSSRTIVNHNPLPEMTVAECIERLDGILSRAADAEDCIAGTEKFEFWFHFEGRIPDVVLQSMKHLRRSLRKKTNVSLSISVELEKPGRQGLQELVEEADLVFYSRGWAEHEGYASAEDCVIRQALMVNDLDALSGQTRQRTLMCTWGSAGAWAISQGSNDAVHSSAYQDAQRRIVDTTGAGDTFIAGILFAFVNRHGRHTQSTLEASPPRYDSSGSENVQWSLKRKLDFANELAGRKILQSGYAGLADMMKATILRLDQ